MCKKVLKKPTKLFEKLRIGQNLLINRLKDTLI